MVDKNLDRIKMSQGMPDKNLAPTRLEQKLKGAGFNTSCQYSLSYATIFFQ
jgi:hypothetical protein